VDRHENTLSGGIARGGGKSLRLSQFERDVAAGVQGDRLDAAVLGIAGAFADTTREDCKCDDG
jgi:hypothetical protein